MHKGFICDGCGANPITGTRYKCSVRPDFDLCEKCEQSGKHGDHNMLKIRRATQAPQNFVCQYRPQHPAPEEQKQESADLAGSRRGCKSKFRYQGRFVKESFGDKFEVQPGQEFTKQWTIRNAGEIAWPDNVQFF